MSPFIKMSRTVLGVLLLSTSLMYATCEGQLGGYQNGEILNLNRSLGRDVNKTDEVNGNKKDQVEASNASFVDSVTDMLAKRFVGNDTVLKNTRRKPKVPSYVWMLYNAIEEEQTHSDPDATRKDEVPTIRAIKSDPRRGRLLQFQLKDHYKQVDRLEIALKVTEDLQALVDRYDPAIDLLSTENVWIPFRGQRYQNFLIFDISSQRSYLKHVLIMKSSLRFGERVTQIFARHEPILVIFENKNDSPVLREDPGVKRVKRNVEEGINRGSISQGAADGAAAGGQGVAGAGGVVQGVASGGGGVQGVSSGGGNGNAASGGELPEHMSYFDTTQAPPVNQEPSYHCRRYNWVIDMGIFNWSWFAYPNTMELGFCRGSCPFPLDVEMLNSTNYSFLKNRWHVETYGMDDTVPRACCTPVSYQPASIIYVSASHNFVVKTLPNMRVVSCGCR